MKHQERLLALMTVYGVGRRRMAKLLHLSLSAFNRKLRENRLSEEEVEKLDTLWPWEDLRAS